MVTFWTPITPLALKLEKPALEPQIPVIPAITPLLLQLLILSPG